MGNLWDISECKGLSKCGHSKRVEIKISMVPKCTINKAQGRIQTSVLDQGKYFLNKSRLPAKGRQDLESQAKKSDMKTLNIFSPVKRSFIAVMLREV